NTTDWAFARAGGLCFGISARTLSGGRPISAAAISVCSAGSSVKPWAAKIASARVGASTRTRRGPYLVFQASLLFLFMNFPSFPLECPRVIHQYAASQQKINEDFSVGINTGTETG